jgi:hypothetical protein
MSAPLGGLLPCSAHAATDDFMRIDKLPDEMVNPYQLLAW